MASPGIYAVRQPAAAPGSTRPQRSLGASGSAQFDRQHAQLAGELKLNGLAGVAALLVGIWAVDRYVVDLPFIRATGR